MVPLELGREHREPSPPRCRRGSRPTVSSAKPGDRSPQTFFEAKPWLVPKIPTRRVDRRERVPNVSGARLLVLRADRLAKDLSDHPQNVEQRRALADGNIADRSRGGLRRIAGEQVCLHGVI